MKSNLTLAVKSQAQHLRMSQEIEILYLTMTSQINIYLNSQSRQEILCQKDMLEKPSFFTLDTPKMCTAL